MMIIIIIIIINSALNKIHGVHADFYPPGHILPSLLACIAALGESYPVERNRFPWDPRTAPPLLVGGNHCVLTVGPAQTRTAVWLGVSLSPAQWLLVPRVLGTLRWKVSA